MPRRLSCLLAVPVLFFARNARAVDFADARDDFALTIAPPGLPACVTYPIDRFDRVECDGLDPAREAAERASSAAGMEWVAASVFRADSWGFRLYITRADVAGGPTGESGDRALLSSGLDWVKRSFKPAQLVGGDAAPAGELRTVNGARIARFAFAFKAEGVGVLQSIDYLVPSELGLYSVTFVAERAHAAELDAIAGRAMQSLHVRPRPRFPPFVATLLLYVALPVGALIGVVFLVLRLSSIRRGASATVSWPGRHDDGRP